MVLTAKEVAQELGVNVNYVYKLFKSGLLPFLKLGSKKVRVESLEAFLKQYEGQDVDKILEEMGL